MPRNRSERLVGQDYNKQVRPPGQNVPAKVPDSTRNKKNKGSDNNLPSAGDRPPDVVNAVSITKDALTNNYNVLDVKGNKVNMKCLIDTGATITIISYDAWNKLGKPKVESSSAGHILLSNNDKVPIAGSISTSIIVGSDLFPIKMWLVPVWRYEVISSGKSML